MGKDFPMLMPKNKKPYFSVLGITLVLAVFLTSGFGCKLVSKNVQEKLQPITLNYWRVYDDEDAFSDIITAYRALHPNITINYRKFRYEEYEQALLDAWAEDRGPDIFSIPQDWLTKYQTKIGPMPPEITMAFQQVKGTFKKEVVADLKTYPTMSLRALKDSYADTVYQNVILGGKIYALPLTLETLVMFYNRDILNRAGVAQPPATWEKFQEAVQKITRFDSEGKIVQAGTALGTGTNVERCFDVLSVLMMQNGAEMTDANGYPIFLKNKNAGANPGLEAIKFYSDFASPTKNVYSWNLEMPPSLDAFLAGQVGLMFGYNYHLPTIRARAPRLRFGLAPIPQVNSETAKNYANYWVETVAKKSKNQNEAWDFILFAAKEENVKKFLSRTNKPAALKSLISSQLENEDLNATSRQTLTAANWYRGKDSAAADKIFQEMADQILNANDDKELLKVLETATQKLNQTMP